MEIYSYLSCVLSLFFLSFSFSYLYTLSNSQKRPSNDKSGFKLYPIIGILPGFFKNRHRFLDWTTEVLSQCPTNTSVLSRPDNARGVITANPANVEYILKTNFENYPKGMWFTVLLQDFLGDGIFNTDGDVWKLQRKTASYEFNTKSLRNFIVDNVKVEVSSRLVPILAKASETKRVLHLQDILERFSFDNICKLAFNVDPACLGGGGTGGGEFMRAFQVATTLSMNRIMYVFPHLAKLGNFLNIGGEATLRKSIKIVHQFADEIIQSRIEGKTAKNEEDLLSRFMENHSMENRENLPKFLRDIVVSFILAGRDTTSAALSWFFWLLSSNPEVEKTILKELETIRARNGKKIGDTFSLEELRNMHYLHAAISEALRLYPPVPLNTKLCKSDDTLPDGTVIKRGWFVAYNSYAMGRMENIWGENCREFVPERWLDKNGICRQESPFKFPIFHAGPRTCLGKDMAYIQMKSIAASVIERFQIDVLDKEKCPEYVLSLTIRIKSGLPVRVKQRSLS